MERKEASFHWDGPVPDAAAVEALLAQIAVPTDGRIIGVQQALRGGAAVAGGATRQRRSTRGSSTRSPLSTRLPRTCAPPPNSRPSCFAHAKRHGFSDKQIASLRAMSEDVVRGVRHALGVRPVYKTVDTCAAEFAARRPTTTRHTTGERGRAPGAAGRHHPRLRPQPDRSRRRVRLLLRPRELRAARRGLRHRDGQLQPRDRLDRLRHLEPALLRAAHARGRPRSRSTREAAAGPVAGVIVQLGGQTPLGLAQKLKDEGVRIVGTSPEAIHLAEDRGAFGRVLATAPARAQTRDGIQRTRGGRHRAEIGYPVLVRPSYVLGGRGMEIVYDDATLAEYVTRAAIASPEHPILDRPVPRRCHRDRRRRPLRRRRHVSSAGSWSTSRRPASTLATPRARCPRQPSDCRNSSGCDAPRWPWPRASACAG
jgi:carbamoyl-phosphate synthase large subunit